MIDENFQRKTKRLVIRFLKVTDYELWRDLYLSLQTPKNRWCSGLKHVNELSRSQFRQLLNSHAKSRKTDFMYHFFAFEKKSGEIVGYASLMDISRAIFQNAYLGYEVFSCNWTQGYGKEMVDAVMGIAFKNLKLHRLEAGIDPKNRNSIALAKSLGLRREGLSKRRLFVQEKWSDMAIYAITNEEYRPKN